MARGQEWLKQTGFMCVGLYVLGAIIRKSWLSLCKGGNEGMAPGCRRGLFANGEMLVDQVWIGPFKKSPRLISLGEMLYSMIKGRIIHDWLRSPTYVRHRVS